MLRGVDEVTGLPKDSLLEVTDDKEEVESLGSQSGDTSDNTAKELSCIKLSGPDVQNKLELKEGIPQLQQHHVS